jgi:hypothetical protein
MTKNELFSAQLLIEKGLDYSQANLLGISPISIAAALARTQCDSRDELKLNAMQAMMFAGIAASCIAGCLEGDALELIQQLSFLATIVPIALTLKNTKSLADRAAVVGIMGLSFVPGISIAAQALATYSVGKGTFAGITTAWKYRHIETARPIRNAVILGTNAAYSGKKLVDSVTSTIKAIEMFPEYEKELPELLKTKQEECLKQSIDPNECTGQFIREEFVRFVNEGWFSLPGGNFGPDFCKGQDLKSCLNENNLNPGLRTHAEAILGTSANAPESECKTAYKNLSRQYHPDKGGDTEMFKVVASAKERLCDKPKTSE